MGVSAAPTNFVSSITDTEFFLVVGVCSLTGLIIIALAAVCWYRAHQRNKKSAELDYEYPGNGIHNSSELPGDTSRLHGYKAALHGDRKLAQSAQMYHYQHQKQQMIALEKANSEMKQEFSGEDSDLENHEGDYTVYECPGLAPAGEMEVRNPLFQQHVSTDESVTDDTAAATAAVAKTPE